MSDEKLRMDAYYYGFDETGVREIDLILSAVACAGKAYHHTEMWCEECTWPGHEGDAPVDWIYNAAKRAADEIERLRAELAKRDELLREAYGHRDKLWPVSLGVRIDAALGGGDEKA